MLDKLKQLGQSLVSKAPLIIGLVLGYLASPLLKVAIDLVVKVLKLFLG